MRIEKKHLVTGALLAFVAVTGVTLAVKETSHARAVAEAESSRPALAATETASALAPDAPAPGVAAAPADPLPAPEPAAAVAETAPPLAPPPASPAAAPARPKVPAAPIAASPEAPKPAAAPVAAPVPAEPPTTIFVTYFHTTARCTSCIKIENLTEMTMTTRLSGPVAEKRVVFRSVNVDEPANAHFVKDYSLYTKSVVVSEVKGGFEVRWKNLDRVWHLLGNPESFQSYVEKEVQGFLDPA